MKKWIFIVIFVVLLGAVVAWRIKSRADTGRLLASQAATRKGSASNVVISVAKPGDIVEHLQTVGSLNTPFDIKLASKVPGVVDQLDVRPGDAVKAGQVLVRINPIEQEATVAQMRSALAQAQHQYTQALITETPTDTNVNTVINQDAAALASAQANEGQVVQNSAAQVQTAQSNVTDANSKVAAALSQQGAAQQAVISAQANDKDATAKYTREYNLYKQGYVAAQDVDDAEAAKGVQDAAVSSAQQSLDAAKSAVGSARAQLVEAQQNLAIVKKQQQANIVAAKAQTNTARQALKYARSNTAAIPAYKQNLAALKSVADADKAELDNAIAQVGDTILKTPFDGTVTNRLIDPGSMASVGQQLLEVQFLDWLYVTCTAPVEYVSQVTPGEDATITFDALPGQTFHAPVVLVTPAADPSIRQFTFEIRLDNKNHSFKPGMFGHVDIVVGKSAAGVLVPREAVKSGDTGNTVTTVTDITTDANKVVHGTAHTVIVQIGKSDPKNIEILKGVKAGDKVISISYRAIRDGTKVTINPDNSLGKNQASPTGGGGGEPAVGSAPSVTTSSPGALSGESGGPGTGGQGTPSAAAGSATGAK
jgi:HlyD family secretion protein